MAKLIINPDNKEEIGLVLNKQEALFLTRMVNMHGINETKKGIDNYIGADSYVLCPRMWREAFYKLNEHLKEKK